MKHYFLTLLFLLTTGVAGAQEFTLSGKVVDAGDGTFSRALRFERECAIGLGCAL